MYGLELMAAEIPQLAESVHSFTDGKSEDGTNIHRLAKKLEGQSKRLFHRLSKNALGAEDDEAERFAAAIDEQAQRQVC